jgi:hypothetical protein
MNQQYVRFWVNGVSLAIVGVIGIVGNTASIFKFSKKVANNLPPPYEKLWGTQGGHD